MKLNVRQKKVVNADCDKGLCLAIGGSGKGLLNSEYIPTINGMKKVEDIKVGDYLFDENGKPTKVLGVYPRGVMDVYKLTFGDGREANCSIDHIWHVHSRNFKDKNKFVDMTVEELLKKELITETGGAVFSIPQCKAVKYPEKIFKVHPYIIGAFIGDGCCLESTLTISSENETIPTHIKELLKEMGFKSPYFKRRSRDNYSWAFYDEDGSIRTKDVLPKDLIVHSYDKKIPEEYKYGSINQRLELLRGLMDTDGSVSYQRNRKTKGMNVRFTTTSKALSNDVQQLVLSLGYKSHIGFDKRGEKYTTGAAYEVSINCQNDEFYKVFWLPRKKEIALKYKDYRKKKRYDVISIRKIEKTDKKEEITCFYVDSPNHLFLMKDYVVTHNTAVLAERTKRLLSEGVDPKDLILFTFTKNAANEMIDRVGSICKGAYIGTIHGYANYICQINNIDTSDAISTGNFDIILRRAVQIDPENYVPVKHILVDECQDLTPLEFQFIEMIPTENIFYFGDFRQMIYGFKGVKPDRLLNMCRNVEYTIYKLCDNYRNPPNIIKFAESFVQTLECHSPNAIPVLTRNGILETNVIFDDVVEIMKAEKDYVNWTVLTRTNEEVKWLMKQLDRAGIPNITFKKDKLESDEISDLMTSDVVKVLTCHTVKGMSIPKVVAYGFRPFNQEEQRICYVAATRAIQALYWCKDSYKGTRKRNHLDNAKNKSLSHSGTRGSKVEIIEF